MRPSAMNFARLLLWLTAVFTARVCAAQSPNNDSLPVFTIHFESRPCIYNQDGLQEFYIPWPDEYPEHFVIYDRWGNTVHESRHPRLEWDGRKDGKPCPDGVYWFSIQMLNEDGRRYLLRGLVAVMSASRWCG